MKRTLKHIKYERDTEELAAFAKALSHPTRIAILKFLDNKSCSCTGDLQELLPIAQSTISQHIKELKNAGLIVGELNPPKINYTVNRENLSRVKTLFDALLSLNEKCISEKC